MLYFSPCFQPITMRNLLFCILFSFIVFPDLQAQTTRRWEAGLGLGAGSYFGDLRPGSTGLSFAEAHPSASVHLRRIMGRYFAGKFSFTYSGLSGNDLDITEPAWRQTRAFSFEGKVEEAGFQGEVYPLGLLKNDKKGNTGKRLLSPYVTLGFGIAFFQPKVDWNESNSYGGVAENLVQKDRTDTPGANIDLPMGLGLRIAATQHLALGFEAIFRYNSDDYLDGVSEAADPLKNDWFYTLQATASYAFGKKSGFSHRARKDSNQDDRIPSADLDSDGVPDDRDDCPEIPGLKGMRGCPDADRDGVIDQNDLCPDSAGVETLGGCPDRDGDGVADKDDNCPDLKGEAAYFGCPAVDRDNDGVADAEDLCPDMTGQRRWKGCPDSDSDGIPDNKDACPGIAGPDQFKGCPDTDEDGISDKEDECPTIAGIPAKNGCPEAAPPSPGVPYKALYFNSTVDDWQITSMITFDEIIFYMNADSTLFASIEGHTDDTGKEPANDLLSEKRAKRCFNMLVARGVDPARLNYIGYGAKHPAVPNTSRENRQLNRRVEVHFYKK